MECRRRPSSWRCVVPPIGNSTPLCHRRRPWRARGGLIRQIVLVALALRSLGPPRTHREHFGRGNRGHLHKCFALTLHVAPSQVPALSLSDDERDVRTKALETAVNKSADDSEEDALHKQDHPRNPRN